MRALAPRGFTIEQIADIDEVLSWQDPERVAAIREQTRIRVQNHRARNACNAVTDVTSVTPLPLDKKNPPHPLKDLIPAPPCVPAASEAFASFWAKYPITNSKKAALKAFESALKRAPVETIMAGLDRYLAKQDNAHWAYAATWLNGDRWNDQHTSKPLPQAPRPPGGRQTLEEAIQNLEERRNGSVAANGHSDWNDDQRPGRVIEHEAGEPHFDLRPRLQRL